MKARSILMTGLLVLTIGVPAFGQADFLPVYTVSVSQSAAVTGEPILVEFTAPMGASASDWIGFYHMDDPNTMFRCVHFTGGAASGSFWCDATNNPGTFEFRYLVNNSYTSVAESTSVIIGQATGFNFDLSDNATYGGGPITLDWTAPLGRPVEDWIGLFREGEADNHNYDPARWIYTGGATSGTHTFQMPKEPGKYVFRYLLRDRYVSVSESALVTVTAFSVTPGASWVYCGTPMTLNFTAPVGQTRHDWIGLYRVGEPNSAYLWFTYTNGQSSGSITQDCFLGPGTYEYRYFIDNGYAAVAVSTPFTVVEPVGFVVSVDQTTVSPGASVIVSWSGPPGGVSPTDWIGLFAVGADNREWIQYVYTGGAPTGSATFTMPNDPGTYEFRYLLRDRFFDAARTLTVNVQ